MVHPLHQIASSPTHKLLLKQWLKESDLIGRRTAVKHVQISKLQSSITFLHCFFFLFHSIFIIFLFQSPSTLSSRHSWIPCLLSLLSSMAIAWAVRYKTDSRTV
ncbi:hypothetical protein ZOSMA_21G00220 [Zostera marina]|uniref:Uncharacterized protein n=1 Tax=Zostera marina TaxID=29655 RepID=A0A0K9PLS6_ZOSMR|nr:hypothetical protein ZOSMA_21G00220 [Zostera marina]